MDMDHEARALASSEFLVLLPKPPVTREFIFCLCRSDEFIGEFAGLASGTSTSHQRVRPENLERMPLLVPPSNAINKFSLLVRPVIRTSQVLRQKNANLRHSRDLLLPKLISGEVPATY